MMTKQQTLVEHLYNIPLAQLAEQVLRGTYTPGVHDVVLVTRCRSLDIANLTNEVNDPNYQEAK